MVEWVEVRSEAGAKPLNDCHVLRTLRKGAEPTLSSYIRDNSDLRNGPNSFVEQKNTGIPRVEETAVNELPESLSECSPRENSNFRKTGTPEYSC